MYDLPASIPRETEMWHGKEENNNGKFSNGEFSTSGFRACLNNAIDGQRAAQAYIHRLGNWTLFEWVISFQATIIVLNVLSALAVSIVEYLNPRPMLLLALILFIPIFPTLYSNQHEENLKLFGWIQLVCGFVELFWSSCVLLDMHYHSNDWRAYFAMCAVSWQVKHEEYFQFMSVILISIECPLLEKIMSGQRNRINTESNITTESSSCSVDLRIAKLRTALNFEKQRLDERKKRQEERLKRDKFVKDSKEFADNMTQSEEINSQTARDISDLTANKMSDLNTTKEQQNDKHNESERSNK
ncbi:putative integral membrane protein [Acanthocheilonema viteae]